MSSTRYEITNKKHKNNKNNKNRNRMKKVKQKFVVPNKTIGIVGHYTGHNSFGVSKPYLEFFRWFGRVTIINPFEQDVQDLDLLVLPGGPDVSPWRYLEPEDELSIMNGSPCFVREHFDRHMLPQYIAAEVPIFGICRGHQTLAVHFGAKLVQDMYHETNADSDGAKLMHGLLLNHDAILNIPTIPIDDFKVNSRHHQTVMFPPANATVLAIYDGKWGEEDPMDNEIEALTYWPNYPAHTVQWHPEDARDLFSAQLIRHLLSLSDEEVQVN